jgi:DNA-binding MarR family transcriptional regulator
MLTGMAASGPSPADPPDPEQNRQTGAASGPGSRTGREPERDEVDRLVAAWRRERPDLDAGPIEVLSRVSRLALHLDRARRHTFRDHQLQAWEFDVLAALRRAGAPYELSPGDLLTQTLVTSGTMTNRIDRLADRGLVSRRPDPRDRRGVVVMLAEQGRARVDAAFSDLLDQEEQILAALPPADRVRLADLLRRITLRFDRPATPGPPAPR